MPDSKRKKSSELDRRMNTRSETLLPYLYCQQAISCHLFCLVFCLYIFTYGQTSQDLATQLLMGALWDRTVKPIEGHLSLRRKSLYRFAGKNRRYPPDEVLRIGMTQRSPHSVGAVEAHQTACLRKLLAQVEGSGRPVLVSRAVARLPCLLSTFTLYTLLALERWSRCRRGD